MTITIDCRMIDASGVGVYLRECLPYFLDSSHLFFLLGGVEELSPIVKGKPNAEILRCTIKPFSLKERFLFPRDMVKKINQSDLFYTPFFNIPAGIKVPIFTTIHDIIFPDMPELTSKPGLVLRMLFYHRAFRRSKKIFTVSQFSKSRIEYYAHNTKPVIVTYSAIQPYLLENQQEEVHKKDFILFIGNIKKHKGLRYLLDAFFQASIEGFTYRLLIVGHKDNFRSQDRESFKKLDSIAASIREKVVFTGSISNEHLRKLLREAAFLVQPSLYEGFGLPPLEAMMCGTAALISDIPVFKEIYADFPVTFFKADNTEDLKEKLLEMEHKHQPIVLSEALQSRYTFEKTAAIILRELTT